MWARGSEWSFIFELYKKRSSSGDFWKPQVSRHLPWWPKLVAVASIAPRNLYKQVSAGEQKELHNRPNPLFLSLFSKMINDPFLHCVEFIHSIDWLFSSRVPKPASCEISHSVQSTSRRTLTAKPHLRTRMAIIRLSHSWLPAPLPECLLLPSLPQLTSSKLDSRWVSKKPKPDSDKERKSRTSYFENRFLQKRMLLCVKRRDIFQIPLLPVHFLTPIHTPIVPGEQSYQ